MKLLSMIGSLSSVASAVAPSAVQATAKAGLPDPAASSDARIKVAYDFPLAKKLFSQYEIGVHTIDGKFAKEIYIDYVFKGLPVKAGDLMPNASVTSVSLDEHYAFVRSLSQANSIIRVYPNNDNELQSARLTDIAAITGAKNSYLDFYKANGGWNPTTYKMDLAKGRWWFGGDDKLGPTNTVNMPFSNEVMVLAYPGSNDLIQFGLTDLYDYTDPNGKYKQVRFDSEFYIDPVSKKIQSTPTSANPIVQESISTIGVPTDAGIMDIDPESIVS